MATQPEIEQRLLEFVRAEIFRNQGELTAETNLVAAGFDSMSLVAVLLFVEREYGAWIAEQEMTAGILANVRSLAAHVSKHLA